MTPAHIRCVVPIALSEVFERLAPQFTSELQHQLTITYMLNPEVPEHVLGGAAWDLAISNPWHINQIIDAGLAARETHRFFARSPLALAVLGKDQTAVTSDPSEIRDILQSARNIAVTDIGTSGKMFDRLMEKLGVSGEINDRVLRLEGGGPMRALLAGEAEIAVLPNTNIAPISQAGTIAVCAPELDVHIDLSMCLNRSAATSAARLLSWLENPERDEVLAEMGAMRFSL